MLARLLGHRSRLPTHNRKPPDAPTLHSTNQHLLRPHLFGNTVTSFTTLPFTMSDPTGSFPRFDDGNVKIILSHKPADTLLLHSAILGRDQSFFKASLEKLDWADNKYIWRRMAGSCSSRSSSWSSTSMVAMASRFSWAK